MEEPADILRCQSPNILPYYTMDFDLNNMEEIVIVYKDYLIALDGEYH